MVTSRLVLSVAGVFAGLGSALAGPCTERIHQLEIAVTQQFEGGGPAVTGSTQPQTSGATAGQSGTTAASAQEQSRAMNLLTEAKRLDQQGNEAACMQTVSQVESMTRTQAK